MCTYHHPVFRVYKVNRSSGFPLHRFMDNTASDTINQEDSNKAALLMGVRAFRYHSQKIRVQILQKEQQQARQTTDRICD